MISLEELWRYTAATPTTRNMCEGQQVINSGLLIMCGVTAKTSVNIQLYALCLQTSSIISDPLKHSNLVTFYEIFVFLLRKISKKGPTFQPATVHPWIQKVKNFSQNTEWLIEPTFSFNSLTVIQRYIQCPYFFILSFSNIKYFMRFFWTFLLPFQLYCWALKIIYFDIIHENGRHFVFSLSIASIFYQFFFNNKRKFRFVLKNFNSIQIQV